MRNGLDINNESFCRRRCFFVHGAGLVASSDGAVARGACVGEVVGDDGSDVGEDDSDSGDSVGFDGDGFVTVALVMLTAFFPLYMGDDGSGVCCSVNIPLRGLFPIVAVVTGKYPAQ